MACTQHEPGLGCAALPYHRLGGCRRVDLSSSCSVALRPLRLAMPSLHAEARHSPSPVTAVASPPANPRPSNRTDTRRESDGNPSSSGRQGPLASRRISRPSGIRGPQRQLTRTNQGLNTVLARIQQKRASGAILQQGLVAAESPPRPDMQPMERLELERGVCKPFKKYSPERVRMDLL